MLTNSYTFLAAISRVQKIPCPFTMIYRVTCSTILHIIFPRVIKNTSTHGICSSTPLFVSSTPLFVSSTPVANIYRATPPNLKPRTLNTAPSYISYMAYLAHHCRSTDHCEEEPQLEDSQSALSALLRSASFSLGVCCSRFLHPPFRTTYLQLLSAKNKIQCTSASAAEASLRYTPLTSD